MKEFRAYFCSDEEKNEIVKQQMVGGTGKQWDETQTSSEWREHWRRQLNLWRWRSRSGWKIVYISPSMPLQVCGSRVPALAPVQRARQRSQSHHQERRAIQRPPAAREPRQVFKAAVQRRGLRVRCRWTVSNQISPARHFLLPLYLVYNESHLLRPRTQHQQLRRRHLRQQRKQSLCSAL